MSADEDKLQKARFFFELASKTDEMVEKANERLRKKIQGVFSVSSTMVPIVLGIGYFILKESNAYWVIIPMFISLLAFVYAIAKGISLFKPKGFKYVNPKKAIKKYKNKSLTFTINKSASTLADTAVKNVRVINDKEDGLNQMLTAIVFGSFMLAIAFLLLGISLLLN